MRASATVNFICLVGMTVAWPLGIACDSADTERTVSAKPAAQAVADEGAVGKSARGPDDKAARPDAKPAVVENCDIGRLFDDICPFTAEEFGSLLGVEGELTLETDARKHQCTVKRGKELLAYTMVVETSAKGLAKEAEGHDDLLKLGMAEAIDVGVPNCKAMFRGSAYDYMNIIGKSHMVNVHVYVPTDPSRPKPGSPEKIKQSADRAATAQRIASALGERLR